MAIAIRGTTPAVSLTNSNPVSVSLTGSRQPQSGDRLIIIHGNDYYLLSNMPTPTVGGSTAGVNALATADKGTDSAHAKGYFKDISSTGDLTVSVTETGSANEEKALAVYVLSGCDSGATPLSAGGFGDDPSHVAPSLSPSATDDFLICHTNTGTGVTVTSFTPPSGMTESYDQELAGGITTAGAVQQLSASGSTGTKAFTAGSTSHYATLSISVKTAVSGPSASLAVTAAITAAGALTVTEVTRVAVTTGAPGAATAFSPTLPTHATGDRMILAVVGKYNTATIPTINQSWVLVGSGTGGTGTAANDTGQTFWAVYAKDATSSSETAPTVTPGGTAPNSWEWICATHRPATGKVWADAIGASAAWVQSASDTNTASPLTGTAGAWTGVQPTTDDAIFAVGVIPTDLGTALGATTLTATGLSGGTKTTATSQYIENALNADTAAVWAGWIGIVGTASAGLAMSFTITGATNQSGSLIAIALRQQSGSFSGSSSPSWTATITAAGNMSAAGSASRAATATITSNGQGVGSASRSTTATVASSGQARGSSATTWAATITAAGVLTASGSASVNAAASLASSGQTRGSSSPVWAATVTAVGGLGAFPGQAAVSETATITADGQTQGSSSPAWTASITAAGGLVGFTDRAQSDFRGRNDDGNETAATWKAATNADWSQAVDEPFRVRFAVTSGEAVEWDFKLYYSLNGGTWTRANGASVLHAVDSLNVGNATATTQQITGGTFTAGSFDDDDGHWGGPGFTDKVIFAGDDVTELETCYELIGTDVSNGDEIDLRVYYGNDTSLESYLSTPTLTVASGASSSSTWAATIIPSGQGEGAASRSTTATVAAAGNMSASGAASLAGAASITSSGRGEGSSSPAWAATIVAAGVLTASGQVAISETASIVSSGRVQGTAAVSGTATIIGVGAGQGAVAVTETANISSSGRTHGSANPAWTATISAEGGPPGTGSAALNAVATITAAGQLTASGSASLTETASILASGESRGSSAPVWTATSAGTGRAQGSAALTETASITGSGRAEGGTAATWNASIAAAGNMSGGALSGTSSSTWTATIAAAGQLQGSGAATVVTVATITAAGVLSASGSASLSIIAQTTTVGQAQGSASRSTTATVTSSGRTEGSVSVSATVSITAVGRLTVAGSATLNAAATIIAVGYASGIGISTPAPSRASTGAQMSRVGTESAMSAVSTGRQMFRVETDDVMLRVGTDSQMSRAATDLG